MFHVSITKLLSVNEHTATPSGKAGIQHELLLNLPAMQEIRVQSLGQEDTLEKEMATPSCMLDIPWTEEPVRLQSWDCTGSLIRHD